MAKQLIYDAEAREKLRAGVDKLANAVRITLARRDATSSSTRNSEARPSPTTVSRSRKRSSSRIRTRTWARRW
jgi:hypothetical protein